MKLPKQYTSINRKQYVSHMINGVVNASREINQFEFRTNCESCDCTYSTRKEGNKTIARCACSSMGKIECVIRENEKIENEPRRVFLPPTEPDSRFGMTLPEIFSEPFVVNVTREEFGSFFPL